MNHSYTTYILECSDGSYYVGVTNDVESRLIQHNIGEDKKAYTFKRRPVKLVFAEHFPNVEDAIAFEKQVKGWRREKKEALIRRDWDALPELAKDYRDK